MSPPQARQPPPRPRLLFWFSVVYVVLAIGHLGLWVWSLPEKLESPGDYFIWWWRPVAFVLFGALSVITFRQARADRNRLADAPEVSSVDERKEQA